jgi:pyruvate kinase
VNKRSKYQILATLGPSSLNNSVIKKLDDLEIDLLRLNMSHVNISSLEGFIKQIRQLSKIPICIDTEGAQVRSNCFKNNAAFFKKGSVIKIHKDERIGDNHNMSFSPTGIVDKFQVNDVIYIDFNSVSLKVIEKNRDYLDAQVLTEGEVGSNKASNLNREIELDVFTDKDLQAFEIGMQNNINNYSLSFTNHSSDVDKLREYVGNSNIISKIESKKGVKNLLSITKVANQILIDRGDLSREVSIEKIPFVQRKIIEIANQEKTPVFVATNLLESMIKSSVPNRAEVNDVISTLQMGANGLVLAAETAIGKYPVDAVKMIKSLIDEFKSSNQETILDNL